MVGGDGVTAEEAALALGRCQLELGDPAVPPSVAVAPRASRARIRSRRRDAHASTRRARCGRWGGPRRRSRALDGLTGPARSRRSDCWRWAVAGAGGGDARASRHAAGRHRQCAIVGLGGDGGGPLQSSRPPRRWWIGSTRRPKVPEDLRARRLYQDARAARAGGLGRARWPACDRPLRSGRARRAAIGRASR